LAVPLIVNDKPFGVLNAEHPAANAFDVYTRRLLDLFASQAAVLINERILLETAYEKEKNAMVELRSADMTRMTAHHIKNYLGSAITYLADATALVDVPQPVNEKLGRVDANMRRCIAITQELFKPYSSEKRSEVDIHYLVKDAISRVDCGDDIDVSTHGFASLPRAWLAPGHAIDYFHEILKNAVRACTESLDIGKITRGAITVTGELNTQGQIVLSFTNNGPPIPEDRRGKIFEQFSGYSGKARDGEHYGLGLWGAKTFFQRQDGDVFLRESDDNETAFVVVIPSVHPGGAN
jgi:signal transduction histidine kinase